MATCHSPIALFVYRRTRHLARTLDTLELCAGFAESPIFIFSDGPKTGDEADVNAVRRLVASRCRPNMTIVESPHNRGLASSIIKGVRELCDEFGRVIVVEDDLLCSPALLTWFNRALEAYADVPYVWQVSGHQFPVPEFQNRSDGMFLHFATSWGWATWKRAWDQFDEDASGWQMLAENAEMRSGFDFGGVYPYAAMLENQMGGVVDSWAVRWWWSIFRSGALSLFPSRSLVSNIGEDKTATHAPSRFGHLFRSRSKLSSVVPSLPGRPVLDKAAEDALRRYLARQSHREQRAKAIWSRLRGAAQ